MRLLAAVLGIVAIAVSALAFRMPGDSGRPANALLKDARIDPGTLGIVERACQNCHSERTEWPWYSHIPPASWMIHRDVAQARERLNFSRWDSYTTVEKQALLSAIGGAVRTGAMPPGRYTWLHPKAALSAPEQKQVYDWTRAERRRLRDLESSGPKSDVHKFLWERRF